MAVWDEQMPEGCAEPVVVVVAVFVIMVVAVIMATVMPLMPGSGVTVFVAGRGTSWPVGHFLPPGRCCRRIGSGSACSSFRSAASR